MVLDLIANLKNNYIIKLFIIKKNYNTIYDRLAKQYEIDVVYLNHKIKVFSFLVAFKLIFKMKRFKPDIIHSHLKASIYIYFYTLFSINIKWIHTVHTKFNIEFNFFRRYLFKRLSKQRKVKFVAVSNSVKETINSLYENIDVRVINNGVDLEKFKPGIKENDIIRLVCVGRLELVKNQAFLLKEIKTAFDYLPVFKLFLIGDGSKKELLKKMIIKLGLDEYVEIIEHTNKVEEYLQMCDIFILPSLYEGHPISVIEAMATSLLVITSKASNEIVIDGYNGFIIELNENELAQILVEVVNNLEVYNDLRINAYFSAKQYSITKMCENYNKLYKEVLND